MLKSLADNLGQAAVSGNLSQSIGFNVSSMGLIPPPPSSSDESWKEVMRPLSKYPFFQHVVIGSRVFCSSASGGHSGGHQRRADSELCVQREQSAADSGANSWRVCWSTVPAALCYGCG